MIGYAVELADVTRRPRRYGLSELEELIEFGASPRGPIGLVQCARALAMLRGRRHVIAQDVRDLAPDVLRHRIVLSYEALSDGVSADYILDRVITAVDSADDRGHDGPRGGCLSPRAGIVPPPGRQGPGPIASPVVEMLDLVVARRASGVLPASAAPRAPEREPSWRRFGSTRSGTTSASWTPLRPPARACRTCGFRCRSGCSRRGSCSTSPLRWHSGRRNG